MKKIFRDYLDIFQAYPKDKYHSKQERKARYQLLQAYGNRQYKEPVSIAEFEEFIQNFADQIDIHPQFLEKFTSLFQKDIADGGVFALKFLRGDSEENNYYQKYFHWAYDAFGEGYDLLNLLLEKEPDYEPALLQKYQLLLNGVNFSIHELPWGILDGINGADAENVPEMLAGLDELLDTADRLHRRDQELEDLVAECRIYYLAWQDYLGKMDQFPAGFKAYLDQQGIEY